MKKTNEIINSVLAGNENGINEVNAQRENLSIKAKKSFDKAVIEAEMKLKKLAKPQRTAKLLKMVTEADAQFPHRVKAEKKERGTRQDNAFLNSRKKAVLQLDKTTGQIIKEHESVQAAHRASGVSDSSICYCCNKRTGFKSAGGFAWAYKEGYVAPDQNSAAE